MKSILTLLLVSLVSLVNAQVDKLPSGITCANVRCSEACLDNPTRCVTRCNATKTCAEDKICLNGYCEDKPKLTCASVLCITGTTCLENPIRCVKPCSDKDTCPEGTTCTNGYCEDKPKLTCATVDCRRGYICRENPIRCVKSCKSWKDCSWSTICFKGYCEKIFMFPFRPTISPYWW